MRPRFNLRIAFTALLLSCSESYGSTSANAVTKETIRVQLPAGSTRVDLYRLSDIESAPLVIVAHGFSRGRKNMAGWGHYLAEVGFIAVVPDLPTRADHIRNGQYIGELQSFLLSHEMWSSRIDSSRIGLMGFSAGALSTLFAAAQPSDVSIWIGLDPVERDGMGAEAALRLQARAVVITAEPSSCNAHGNARELVAALRNPEHHQVSGARHVDAEWPTSRLAELFCGRSTDVKRAAFRDVATRALRESLERLP